MTIDALIMLSGAFVAALPFLGFPNSWDTAFFLAAGIVIIALGIVVRRRLARRSHPSGYDQGATAEDSGRTSPAPKNEEISASAFPRNEDHVA